MGACRVVSRVAILVGAVMALWCASAFASFTHPLLSSFGTFTNVQGVAVDQSTGDVYVLDTGAGEGSLLKFDAAGDPLKFTGLPGEPFAITGLKGGGSAENELAVDNSGGPAKGDVYVAVGSSNGEKIDILASDGVSLGSLSKAAAPWGETCGVSVDPSGNVYVGVFGTGVDKFSPNANPVTNADYVSSIGGASGQCNLAVDSAENVFAVKWSNGPVTRYEASQFGSLVASGSVVDSSGSTLAVDPANDHLYVDQKGQVSEFGVHGEPFEEPVSTFAQGTISESYGIAVNETTGDIYVSNGKGELSVFGVGVLVPTVITGEASKVGLHSAVLSGSVNPEGQTVTGCTFEYGESKTYDHSVPCAANPGNGNSAVAVTAAVEGLQALSLYHFRLVTSTAAGESAGEDQTFTTETPKDATGFLGLPDERVYELVSPPNNGDAEVYEPEDAEVFSNTLTENPFQAAADGNGIAYVGSPSVGGNEDAGYFSGNQYVARRSSDGTWTQTNLAPSGLPSAVFEGFSSDLSVGFLDSLEPMSPQAPGFGEESLENNYDVLYTSVTGSEKYTPLFTAHPPNRTQLNFGTADIYHISFAGNRSSNNRVLAYAGASEDSTHVLFEANDALTPDAEGGSASHYQEENNLYESVNGQLRLVNVLPDGSTKANATFGAPNQEYGGNWTSPDFSHVISSNGSRIFWTDINTGHIYVREDGTRTVEISPAGEYWTATSDGSQVFYTDGDLDVYDLENGHTTDLTPGVTVQGVIGASENGEYVYYVTSNFELDLWHDGVVRTIKKLSAQANTLFGDWQPGYANRTAEVASGGHGLVFMSTDPTEVEVYDADNGQLYCASCGSSGFAQQSGGSVPKTYSNTYIKRLISEDGSRVFFESREALVPQDTNGTLDAYEWERPGSGSCKSNASCIYLLSSGASAAASYLADASASGNDVFVVTRAKLLPQDDNENFDLYDARVDGFTPIAPPACTGTGCQGLPGTPPIFATPSSVTFEGVGNFAAPVPVAKAKPKPKKKPKPKTKHRSGRHQAKQRKKGKSSAVFGRARSAGEPRRSGGKGQRS
jgi:hypothetical protein